MQPSRIRYDTIEEFNVLRIISDYILSQNEAFLLMKMYSTICVE